MSGRTTTRTRRRLWQLGGALALAAVVVVAIVLAGGGGADKPRLRRGEALPGQIESNARFIGIQQHGVTLGDPKAKVTLVEFADLQCPFCRRYTEDVMPAIVSKYVQSGEVKMVFRNVAFIGQDSVRAAQMASAAGLQDKLWEFVDLFYANQGEENSGYVTDDFLTKVGGAVKGLDVAKAMNDRGITSIQTQLSDANVAWQSSGAGGTPSFLIGRTGGTLTLMGKDDPLSADTMSARIDQALKGG